jgi:hypothetical protein
MNLSDCICDSSDGNLQRVRYFSRQLLDAHDLTDDQAYHRAKQRMHNRLLHGWGIVCGLEVSANPTKPAPSNVTISAGYALSPQGDEIWVPDEVQFDLATCTAGPAPGCCSTPCSPIVATRVDPAKPFWIGIKFTQCPSRPVRVPPVGCGCDDTACEYSRIRDSFEVTCLDKLPDSYPKEAQPEVDVCNYLKETKVIPCPPCPDSPWIVLAKMQPAVGAAADEFPYTLVSDDRRLLLSVAVIQQDIAQRCT